MLAHLVERRPDALSKSLGISGFGKGQPSSGEQHGRAFGHGSLTAALGSRAQIVPALDHRRSQACTMVETRAGGRSPRRSGLVHVELGRDFAELFETEHRGFRRLGTLNLPLELAR